MTFEAWLEAVNAEFISITEMDRDSWPDQDYYCMWEDMTSPHDAVALAIENEYGATGLEAFGLESAY